METIGRPQTLNPSDMDALIDEAARRQGASVRKGPSKEIVNGAGSL